MRERAAVNPVQDVDPYAAIREAVELLVLAGHLRTSTSAARRRADGSAVLFRVALQRRIGYRLMAFAS